tara:strand:+ start:824 stop:1978 length:1155 start_codon:yes stop_codon:yes gene_type:complete
MSKTPFIISIDGNIGSGKTTLFNNLKKLFKLQKCENIGFVEEPVDEWRNIVDKNHVPILKNLYTDIKKYAFRFQMMAYISRISLLKKMCAEEKYDVLVTERSVYTDKNIFCKMLYDDEIIEHDEFMIYNKWFEEFTQDLNISNIIYVNVDPEICLQRIMKRKREGEKVSIEYLEKLHSYHEKWLQNCEYPVFVIHANYDTSQKKYKSLEGEWMLQSEEIINKFISKCKIKNIKENNILYFSGYCDIKNKKNKASINFIINNNSKIIANVSKPLEIENVSSDVAYYYALIEALKYAKEKKLDNIIIKSNNFLVINQLLGKYKIHIETFRHLHDEAINLLINFKKYKTNHIIEKSNSDSINCAKEAYKNAFLKLPKLFESRSTPKI